MPRLPAVPGYLRAGLAAGVLLLALAPAALAHEGAPRLILEPNRINPGGVVTIRGEDLGAEDEMRVVLVGQRARADLTTVTSDGQGHFTISVQISPEAPLGAYAIKAAGSSGLNLTAALSIDGPAVIEEGGGQVGQDEGFPAVPPSVGGPAAVAPSGDPRPASLPVASVRSVTVSAGTPADLDLVPIVALAGAVVALGMLFWRTRRRPVPPTGSADLP